MVRQKPTNNNFEKSERSGVTCKATIFSVFKTDLQYSRWLSNNPLARE